MRLTQKPRTETEVYEADNGVKITTVPDGTVVLNGSTFHVERVTTEFEGRVTHETHLIGARGSVYLLRRMLERGGDSGLRQVVSLNTGNPWRPKGNEVRVYDIAGVIEVAQ